MSIRDFIYQKKNGHAFDSDDDLLRAISRKVVETVNKNKELNIKTAPEELNRISMKKAKEWMKTHGW